MLQMQTSEPMANCITVATSTEDDHKSNIPVVILESRVPAQHQHPSPPRHHHADAIMMTSPPPIMSTHAIPTTQIDLDQTVNVNPIRGMCTAVEISPESTQQTTVPSATLIKIQNSPTHTDMSVDTSLRSEDTDSVKVKFETLRAMEQSDHLDMDSHLSDRNLDEEPDHAMHTMMITPELLGLIPSSSVQTEINADTNGMKRENTGLGSKTWTQEDMDAALEALRSHSMSLTKASITYGIPSTTLWQRAHRLGIDTPKKDGPAKSWTEDVLNVALEALRNGTISANKASKAYGIPSSTLYKIARREGIRLAAPFNAAPTTWNPEDLERALEAIRSGQTTVQRAATEYGIPSGTLYGRCKREGIELSRSNPTPWSEDAMTEALEAVRMGQMSINQAAIHYNLPYSSLYGRFKRCKYEADHPVESEDVGLAQHHTIPQQIMLVQYQQAPTQLQMYQHTPS
uniref:HTH psq-type domain-containing protein n=1 Tax=Clastoptera arizonana TaxID=38151 RepID=A0A1B6D8Y0_9HEMI